MKKQRFLLLYVLNPFLLFVISSAGLNAQKKWSIGLDTALWTKGNSSPNKYYLPTGAILLAISKKFNVKSHKKK